MSAFVIGIDAGGTSLRAALADAETGDVTAETRTSASPDGGPDALRELLPRLLSGAGIAAGDVRAVCAGITKITRTGVQARWETELAALLPSASVRVVPDFVIAFHGAVPGGFGLSVVAGTGSVVYGENAVGEAARVGGRGWEYGDEGSGAWLTTEAVRRTLRALDGMESPTPLTDTVCDALGTREPAALGEAARTRAASAEGRGFLVPLILEMARNGDGEARNLFVGAGGWLAAQAKAAARRLEFAPDDELAVATVGGLWESGDLLREPFEKALCRWYPAAAVAAPDAAPVIGAVRLARRSSLTP